MIIMGLFDMVSGADEMISELRKALSDQLAEQKKTNELLSKLLEDLSDGQ